MAITCQLDYELADASETWLHNVARSNESVEHATIWTRATRPLELVRNYEASTLRKQDADKYIQSSMGYGADHNNELVAMTKPKVSARYSQSRRHRVENLRGTWILTENKCNPYTIRPVRNNIPWDASPAPLPAIGQWVAAKAADGSINQVLHITSTEPLQAALCCKDASERLYCIE